VLAKGKQFDPASYKTTGVLRIYTVIPVKVLAVIEVRKHLREKSKIHCHLRYRYFVAVNQIVMTTV
jgi:hypothetical protein